jgi:hypothetical protein
MSKDAAISPKIFASRKQVTAALERAAERARVIAEQTGTKLIVNPASPPMTVDTGAVPKSAT